MTEIEKIKNTGKNLNNTQAKCTIVGLMFMNLLYGNFYLWSNISVYEISYLYRFDKTVSYDSVFYVDTFLKLLKDMGHFLGIYLLNSLGLHPKLIIGGASLVAVLGIFMSSYM